MELGDCTWCGSAQSIEYGVCQVCLMRFPEEAEPSMVIEFRDPARAPSAEPAETKRPVAGTVAE